MWLVITSVWLVVVGCAVGSILSQPQRFSARQRLLWILVIIGIPVFGLLAYVPFSVKREGYSVLRKSKSDQMKSPPSSR